MVLNPHAEKVNVTRMIIYSCIPILAIYAAWRIQKFWILMGIKIGIGIVIEMIIPTVFPIIIIVSVATSIVLAVTLVKHFAIKYNEKIMS